MQFAVIGLGRFGTKIIQTLTEHGADVIAIDNNPERVEEVKDKVAIAVALNSTDETAMKAADIDDVDAAVVALGEAQEEAILTTVILKKMGVHPIIARAANSLYADVLRQVGADQVIIIEEQAGENIAKKMLAPEIKEKISLSTGHSLVEVETRKEFVGKTLKELDIRKNYGVNIIAIQKPVTRIDNDGRVIHSVSLNDLPGSDDIIEPGDILVVVGAESDVEKLALSKGKR
ncbi:TrkA family potassium uptake protein [bacterium]|nr:TrkA family potassium uptake protein [bacterium]